MSSKQFTIDDLMDLLVTRVGLPRRDRTDRREVTLTDLGLDSLAFLQLQAELQTRYGVELPDDSGSTQTVGGVVDAINASATVAS